MTLSLTLLLYLSAAVFLAGMGRHVLRWRKTPAPLTIVLTPAPSTRAGVARRLAEEMLGFRALLRADRALWALALAFHASLLMLLIGHIGGLVIPDLSRNFLSLTEPQFHHLAQIGGGASGILALFSVLALLIRRQVNPLVRWISTLGDYFALILLLLIIVTGNQMRFLDGFDLEQARRFVAGWLTFHPVATAPGALFLTHIFLVSVLLIYIPFSKLVHLCGVALFNPALNRVTHENAAT